MQVAKRKRARPKQVDPTRTITLRRRAEENLTRRFRSIGTEIRKLIGQEDAFAIKKPRSLTLVSNAEQDYGAVMLPVKHPELQQVIKVVQRGIAKEDLLKLEDWPHITARFGFKEGVTPEQVQLIVDQHSDLRALVSKNLTLFENKDADILKIDVLPTPQLSALHGHLGILPNVESHPGFHPHITIAYLKPGTGHKYVSPSPFVGELTLDEVVYSTIPALVVVDTEEEVDNQLTHNTRWRFLSNPQKIDEFMRWVGSQLDANVLDSSVPEEQRYWNTFTQKGYAKGVGRSFNDIRKPLLAKSAREVDFLAGSKREFLRQVLTSPESIEQVKILSGRTFAELENVTQDMATRMRRILAEGLVNDTNPDLLARRLNRVLGVGINRSKVIAQTEIVRAHAEGQLDAMEKLGVEKVGVIVEWETAEDARVCKLCQALDGVILLLREARGLIPRHPRCRCAFGPASLTQPKKGQVWGKSRVDKAIARSVGRERPKSSKRSIATQRRLSKWLGAGKRIKRKRPRKPSK